MGKSSISISQRLILKGYTVGVLDADISVLRTPDAHKRAAQLLQRDSRKLINR